ncbi:hypothetical protein FJV41_34355 [Myxococcus llanfairpwllgwyngyllgogerychwyrndrobwllllantysiliogogogochensis]|uniref:Uncharacterized protein n=1 Tax=Myxococcus llanfairpwllgwyngyllgogerychwyrndrobwllllantysiliogogogochensis TaxID=2590453 RepID=A0A540WR78_9BACT|nr:hypothetical protein [Myxococcus llanfairpwllgwyngyllgogerychwyrndrobwllllantysiliogogogochensis]TQF11417.1 hypothetical protein FJV41_34355 [Myxococcus llanfairpwllgwyngyllgogerychwyrndrobwllllantysiliogogogochensis]
MHEIVDLIDRHFSFLKTQRIPHLLPRLRRTMDMLGAEPRIRTLLEEERRALERLHEDFDRRTQTVVEVLKQIRKRFVELVPEVDDASQPRPVDFASNSDPWFRTFAAFDAKLNPSSPLNVLAGRPNIGDRTQAAQLLWILTQKLNESRHARQGELGDEMEQLAAEINQQGNDQVERWRDYRDSVVAAPGADLAFLEYTLRAIGSNQVTQLTNLEERTLSMTGRRSLGTAILEPALSGEDSSDEGRRRAERFEEMLRQALESLHHGLRLRVGTVRSRLVVFERFKTRCEMHDRERLLGLAKLRSGETEEPQSSSQHHPRTKPEQRLTEELARYLYDNGLNPLTEVPIGNARADVLSADRLYVEAKQYIEGNPANYILKGVSQTAHMVERLSSTAYRLDEAFLVVFRRGGKRLVMQSPVTMGTWVLHCVVVDLGEASESGNRAPEAIELTADKIRSAALTSP